MSAIVRFWNWLWASTSEEPEVIQRAYCPTVTCDCLPQSLPSGEVGYRFEKCVEPTEADILADWEAGIRADWSKTSEAISAALDGYYSVFYKTPADSAAALAKLRGLQDRLSYISWFLKDLDQRKRNEAAWALLEKKQLACRHLKGGRYHPLYYKDYCVSDHTFPDLRRQIKCLICGWDSWFVNGKGDQRWAEALQMVEQSTNTRTSSEIIVPLEGKIDPGVNTSTPADVRQYQNNDVIDTFVVADPPSNSIQDQIVRDMKAVPKAARKTRRKAKRRKS
jgi:hypothetical protein